MTSWTVYSIAKLVFNQQVHSKTSMAGQLDQEVDGTYLTLQGLNYREIQTILSQIQKKPRARLPVVTPGLVMTAEKGGAQWFISSQVNQFSTSKRFIARKFD